MMTAALSLSPRAFQRLFPNASKSTFAANFGDRIERKDYAPSLPDAEPQRIAPETLERGDEGEAPSPQRAHLCLTRFGRRLLDEDNLHGGAKPLIDCLKEAGLIHDDSPRWIDLEVKQELAPAGQERTEIEITWL